MNISFVYIEQLYRYFNTLRIDLDVLVEHQKAMGEVISTTSEEYLESMNVNVHVLIGECVHVLDLADQQFLRYVHIQHIWCHHIMMYILLWYSAIYKYISYCEISRGERKEAGRKYHEALVLLHGVETLQDANPTRFFRAKIGYALHRFQQCSHLVENLVKEHFESGSTYEVYLYI